MIIESEIQTWNNRLCTLFNKIESFSCKTRKSLGDRKYLILDQIFKKGFLTSSNVKDFVYPDRCQSTVSKALKHLQDLGLLEKKEFVLGKGYGKQGGFYYLSKRGLDTLISSGLVSEKKENVIIKNQLSLGAYEHKKAILDFWISLEVDCQKYPRYSLIIFYPDWQNLISGNQIIMTSYDNNYEEHLTIKPDATFILKDNKIGENHLFFLEIDLSTVPMFSSTSKDIENRFYKYQMLFAKKAFKKIFPNFKEFNDAKLLFLTNNEKRLMKASNEIYVDPKAYNMILLSLTHEIKRMGALMIRYAKHRDNNMYNLFGKDWQTGM